MTFFHSQSHNLIFDIATLNFTMHEVSYHYNILSCSTLLQACNAKVNDVA